ncbi:MAG: FmdB family zinc ribbon protein [Dokdonella sp.]
MPIYEFECTSCSERFERLQKLSDPDPTVCPECGHVGVRRCVTAPAFRLAGSGWYETDFKKDGDAKRNLASKDEAPTRDSAKGDVQPESTSVDAKPAEKPSVGKADAAKPDTATAKSSGPGKAAPAAETGSSKSPAKTTNPI